MQESSVELQLPPVVADDTLNAEQILNIYLVRSGKFTPSRVAQINSKVTLDENSLVVRFNDVGANNLDIFDGRTDYRFMRGWLNIDKESLKINHQEECPEKTVYCFFGSVSKEFLTINNIHHCVKLENLNQYVEQYKSEDASKIPSLGWLAVKFFNQTHPSAKVTLVDFSHAGWAGHNWDYERKFFAKLVADGTLDYI